MILSDNFFDLEKPSFNLISFGSDDSYVSLSKSLMAMIQNAYKDSRYIIYEKNDLPSDILKYAEENPRGFGYWKWKPYIINKFIKDLADNDIVFYLDGRTDFQSKKIDWLEYFIEHKTLDLAVYIMKHLEYNWTKKSVLEYLNIDNQMILYSGQIAGGIQLFRINNKTRKLYSKWEDISKIDFLINDDLNNDDLSIDSGLVENRHDQSIYSILVKKYYLSNELRGLYFINSERVYGNNSIVLQNKSHPIKKNDLKRLVKKLIPKKILSQYRCLRSQKSKRVR